MPSGGVHKNSPGRGGVKPWEDEKGEDSYSPHYPVLGRCRHTPSSLCRCLTQGWWENCAVYYTYPQSFIITFSYSLSTLGSFIIFWLVGIQTFQPKIVIYRRVLFCLSSFGMYTNLTAIGLFIQILVFYLWPARILLGATNIGRAASASAPPVAMEIAVRAPTPTAPPATATPTSFCKKKYFLKAKLFYNQGRPYVLPERLVR